MNVIHQKILRDSQQDGFIEIWLGIFFLYYTVFYDNFVRELPTQPAMVIFFFIIASFPLIHFRIIRNIFTYPRMGYVNIKMKIPLVPLLVFIIPIATLPLISYVIVHWLRELIDIGLMLKLMSILFGIVFGALYYGFAKSFGLNVYYILTVLSVIIGILFSFIPIGFSGVTAFLALQSIFLFFYGLFMLIRFIRKYPKPKLQPNIKTSLDSDHG